MYIRDFNSILTRAESGERVQNVGDVTEIIRKADILLGGALKPLIKGMSADEVRQRAIDAGFIRE